MVLVRAWVALAAGVTLFAAGCAPSSSVSPAVHVEAKAPAPVDPQEQTYYVAVQSALVENRPLFVWVGMEPQRAGWPGVYHVRWDRFPGGKVGLIIGLPHQGTMERHDFPGLPVPCAIDLLLRRWTAAETKVPLDGPMGPQPPALPQIALARAACGGGG
jgi:hypothetical protein